MINRVIITSAVLGVYIDGEPHVYGDRVYVYGSHDRFNGHVFCLNDYVCYSASIYIYGVEI